LTDISAYDKLAISEPCVGNPVGGDSRLGFVLTCESLVVALELIHVGKVIVFVNILAGYNNDRRIQITK
jgi:hypothetical protein